MKEIIDFVDENDRVMGSIERKKCHDRSLKHRVSAVWVFNDKGELLLQKRAKRIGRSAGKFDHSAAGHVESGISYLDAAKRELEEELGISCKLKKAIKLNNKTVRGKETDDHVFTVFFCKHNKGFKIDKNEVCSIKFHSLKGIERMMQKKPEKFCSSFIKAFKMLKKDGKIKVK